MRQFDCLYRIYKLLTYLFPVHEQHNRLSAISERTRLMRKIQKQHAKIVELSALLELQRLRTYPTLKEFRSFTN